MSRTPDDAVKAPEAEDYVGAWKAIQRMMENGRSWSGRERNVCFLNTGEARFANISGASGLDFLDDGRGAALVDWDHDGDLDLLLSNRTAPQVRFMRNDTPADNHFLAVRLIGQHGNRDAIGARVELRLKDGDDRERIKSLRAGEGFISQSSKWLHFGLGPNTTIDRLIVHWPGGETETFTGLEADRRYRLVEGSGAAQAWTPPARPKRFDASQQDAPQTTQMAQHFLVTRYPVPAMRYRDGQGQQTALIDDAGKPVLVNLWASWCLPCVEELGEFTREHEKLDEAGLAIIALSVDGLGDGPNR